MIQTSLLDSVAYTQFDSAIDHSIKIKIFSWLQSLFNKMRLKGFCISYVYAVFYV